MPSGTMRLDLDQKASHLLDVCAKIGDDQYRDPSVRFRGVCGANGYFVSCGFVDPEGFGGGDTPRQALLSLAKNLRTLADKVEKFAKEAK